MCVPGATSRIAVGVVSGSVLPSSVTLAPAGRLLTTISCLLGGGGGGVAAADLRAIEQEPCDRPDDERGRDDQRQRSLRRRGDRGHRLGHGLAPIQAAIERLRELARGGVAILCTLLERLRDDVVELSRDALDVLAHPRRRLVHLPVQDLVIVVAGERRAPDDHLVEDAAQRIDVGTRIDRASFDLLGRHVLGRADDLARTRDLGLRRARRVLRETEVDDLRRLTGLRIVGEDDVRGLEIAVDDPPGVRRIEPPAQPYGDSHGALDLELLLVLDHLLQRRAAHVLHDEKRRIANNEIEKPRDVVVCDRADRFRFLLEPVTELGIGDQLGLEQLHRDLDADRRVLGDEHLPHRADPEQRLEPVAPADHLANLVVAATQLLDQRVRKRLEPGHPRARNLLRPRFPASLFCARHRPTCAPQRMHGHDITSPRLVADRHRTRAK